MVGDGLNDAPALAAADASMSPVSATHLTQAQADAVFLGDRLGPVAEALCAGAQGQAADDRKSGACGDLQCDRGAARVGGSGEPARGRGRDVRLFYGGDVERLARGAEAAPAGATLDEILAPFELKGPTTHDLDAPMPGRGRSPVQQAWDYAADIEGAAGCWSPIAWKSASTALGAAAKPTKVFDLGTARRAGGARAALSDARRRAGARRARSTNCCARRTAPTRTSPRSSTNNTATCAIG